METVVKFPKKQPRYSMYGIFFPTFTPLNPSRQTDVPFFFKPQICTHHFLGGGFKLLSLFWGNDPI